MRRRIVKRNTPTPRNCEKRGGALKEDGVVGGGKPALAPCVTADLRNHDAAEHTIGEGSSASGVGQETQEWGLKGEKLRRGRTEIRASSINRGAQKKPTCHTGGVTIEKVEKGTNTS